MASGFIDPTLIKALFDYFDKALPYSYITTHPHTIHIGIAVSGPDPAL